MYYVTILSSRPLAVLISPYLVSPVQITDDRAQVCYDDSAYLEKFNTSTLGSLSASHHKAICKVDFPAFDWPRASFPRLRYPLNEFVAENEREEARCLAEVSPGKSRPFPPCGEKDDENLE